MPNLLQCNIATLRLDVIERLRYAATATIVFITPIKERLDETFHKIWRFVLILVEQSIAERVCYGRVRFREHFRKHRDNQSHQPTSQRYKPNKQSSGEKIVVEKQQSKDNEEHMCNEDIRHKEWFVSA